MNKEIREYTVLQNDYLEKLIIEVNKYIQRGWVPYGPFTTEICEDGSIIKYQAMVTDS